MDSPRLCQEESFWFVVRESDDGLHRSRSGGPIRARDQKKSLYRRRDSGVIAEDATEALVTLKKEFPDATHHCWAYVLGNPKTSLEMRMDDDGEPSGTAGKPILNVLQHKNVGDILLVVVRYFGGTKLGAGGLVRAYSSSARGVMECLEIVTNTPLREARLRLDYAEEQPVRRLLEELEVTVSSSTYGEHVELLIRFAEDRSHALEDALAERTSGRVKLVAI